MKEKKLRIVGYTVCALVALAVFLYIRFPGDVFRDYLVTSLEESYPGVALSLGDVAPALPWGVTIAKAELRFLEHGDRSITVEGVRLMPSLIALLQGRTALRVKGTGYGGNIDVRAEYPRAFSLSGPVKAELDCANIPVQQVPALQELLMRKVTGKLNADLTFSGKLDKFREGRGRFKFTVQNGVYPLQEPVMGIDKLDFTIIDGDVQLGERTLKVLRLTLTGEKMTYTLKGNLSLGDGDLVQGSLDMTGTLEVRGTNRKIPFNLSGTFGNPVVRLM
jgi:type II secretion system protein N